MNKTIYFTLIYSLLSISLFSQQSGGIALTIDNKPIYKEELVRAFEENRVSAGTDAQESLASFLESYIDYRLNVEEAYNRKLDTTKAFKRELKSYEFQLKNDYLRDTLAANSLTEAIFRRIGQELEVNHIFVPFEGVLLLPKDTLQHYQKAIELRELARNEGFGRVEEEWSKINAFGVVLDIETQTGYLGWVRAFSFPQKIEELLYSLPLNEITMPVRTEKGYHVFQVVGHRALQGTPVVEQLLFGYPVIPASQQMQDSVYKVALSTYNEILVRDNFSQICEEFSRVFQTGDRGCLLGEVDVRSQYPQPLIQGAYRLQKIGDISKPIQTAYGYHILRMVNKINVPEETVIKQSIRESLNSPNVIQKLLSLQRENLIKRTNAKINADALNRMFRVANDCSPNDSTFQHKAGNIEEVLLDIDGGAKKYSVESFLNYRSQLSWMYETDEDDDPLVMLKVKPMFNYTLSTDILQNQFESFVHTALAKYERESLEAKNPDYAEAIRKISEGVLFAMLQEKEIWNKAKTDKEGLTKFFEKNKKNYRFGEKVFKGAIIHSKDKELLEKIEQKYKNRTIAAAELQKEYKAEQAVQIETGLWKKGDNPYIDSKIYKGEEKSGSGAYPYYTVIGKLISSPEDYTDVKAQAEIDYQRELKEQWDASLRRKYNVVVNNTIVDEIE